MLETKACGGRSHKPLEFSRKLTRPCGGATWKLRRKNRANGEGTWKEEKLTYL